MGGGGKKNFLRFIFLRKTTITSSNYQQICHVPLIF